MKILLSTNTDETFNQSMKITYLLRREMILFWKNNFYRSSVRIYEIYSKGHRNILGIYFDNVSKDILASENGPKGGDEINLIIKGKIMDGIFLHMVKNIMIVTILLIIKKIIKMQDLRNQFIAL